MRCHPPRVAGLGELVLALASQQGEVCKPWLAKGARLGSLGCWFIKARPRGVQALACQGARLGGWLTQARSMRCLSLMWPVLVKPIAWPKTLVVQTNLSQASKCPNRAPQREAGGSKCTKKRAGRKKLKSQPEVEQQPAQEEPPSFDFDNISFELRPLAFYAQSSMRDDGTQIICPQQHFVMGDDMPIYIGFEDVYHFITFKKISANSIMIYIRYLVECCARTGMDQRFEFISPGLVSPVQQNVDRATYVRERANNILRILRNAPKGKRFLMPYNSGQHWILAVIDPWDDSVMYFNPLGNEPGDNFQDLITTALNDWKVLVGSGMRQRRNWQTLIDTVRCPIQE
ncbi:hypothetical protein TIFTF001_046549, partial [Ficus carica]